MTLFEYHDQHFTVWFIYTFICLWAIIIGVMVCCRTQVTWMQGVTGKVWIEENFTTITYRGEGFCHY